MFGKGKGTSSASVEDQVVGYLTKQLGWKGDVTAFPRAGIIQQFGLSSIMVYELYLKAEKRFKVTFEEEDITLDNIDNLDSFVQIVHGALSKN